MNGRSAGGWLRVVNGWKWPIRPLWATVRGASPSIEGTASSDRHLTEDPARNIKRPNPQGLSCGYAPRGTPSYRSARLPRARQSARAGRPGRMVRLPPPPRPSHAARGDAEAVLASVATRARRIRTPDEPPASEIDCGGAWLPQPRGLHAGFPSPIRYHPRQLPCAPDRSCAPGRVVQARGDPRACESMCPALSPCNEPSAEATDNVPDDHP